MHSTVLIKKKDGVINQEQSTTSAASLPFWPNLRTKYVYKHFEEMFFSRK